MSCLDEGGYISIGLYVHIWNYLTQVTRVLSGKEEEISTLMCYFEHTWFELTSRTDGVRFM